MTRVLGRVLIVDDDAHLLRALRITLTARGYNDARATLNTGPDGDGNDRIAATFVLPGQPGLRRRHLVTTHSMDLVRVLGVGYTTADVSLEGSQCLVFYLGGIPE